MELILMGHLRPKLSGRPHLKIKPWHFCQNFIVQSNLIAPSSFQPFYYENRSITNFWTIFLNTLSESQSQDMWTRLLLNKKQENKEEEDDSAIKRHDRHKRQQYEKANTSQVKSPSHKISTKL